MILLLKCPKCGNTMKYESQTNTIQKKSKRCVYCGKSFGVREHVIRRG